MLAYNARIYVEGKRYRGSRNIVGRNIVRRTARNVAAIPRQKEYIPRTGYSVKGRRANGFLRPASGRGISIYNATNRSTRYV